MKGEVANRIRSLRKEKGMTQIELADVMRLGASTVRRYEVGETQPTLEIGTQFADYFDVTLDYIAGRSEKRNEENKSNEENNE